MPYNADQFEKEILEHWKKTDAFKKSVEQRPADKPYVFYDGPPFATGLPHYGHILSSVIKDVVPRYWTMKGYRVRRRWGWDCHGLPVEQLVEKDMNISGKKQIEDEIGVDVFNETCRSKVLTYTKEWKKMVDRIGRWIEFDNAYKTMDSTYMESVWWALKTLWDKELIYEGRKVLLYCPRCETPISKAETAMDNSYKDITEETVTATFKVIDPKSFELPENTYILAWTTTPWTLPGNVALAVGNDIDYSVVKFEGKHYVIAKERMMHYFEDKEFEVVSTRQGKTLVGVNYEPLFDLDAVRETGKKSWYVTDADFVTTEDGTGVVHTAVVYGEDDYNLGKERDLPIVPTLDEKGHFNQSAPEFVRGKYFKQAEKDIKRDLDDRGLLFSRTSFTHSYPHCWRCDTQLIYNAISAWFINLQQHKQKMIELNEKINWYPEHLKHGRFLNILETAPDWNISRNRYWATALPFWKCDNQECNNVVCVGSVAELKDKSFNFENVYSSDDIHNMDLHKHVVDKIKLRCDTCQGEMTRIPEVIDCWLEAASMPYAEFHYPFENKETFEARFPGQFIAEYIAQTRAWFYYMHVMATLLFDSNSFDHVVTTGTIMNEKGEKLSKSKQNYPDPWKIIDAYGMDALRYYLMTSVVMQAENLNFSEREVRDVYNRVINTLWNVLTFYKMFANEGAGDEKRGMSDNVLDKWILAKLQMLVQEVTDHMDNYDVVRAGRPIKEFIDELSTWYVRRSRDRFKSSGTGEEGRGTSDKEYALATLHQVLLTLSKVMAPFTPFIAEKVYLSLRDGGSVQGAESVHLEYWPEVEENEELRMKNEELLNDMELVRKIVETGHSLRKEAGIPVRQPLGGLQIPESRLLNQQYFVIIAEELNVKKVDDRSGKTFEVFDEYVEKFLEGTQDNFYVRLNTYLTDELKKEGLVRELTRTINDMRKQAKMTIEDRVRVTYQTDDEMLSAVFTEYHDELSRAVLADEIVVGVGGEDVSIDGRNVSLSVEKI